MRAQKLVAIRHNSRRSVSATFEGDDEEVMLALLEEPE